MNLIADLLSMPFFKVLATADRHGFRHVVLLVWDRSLIILIVGGIEEMWEIAFLELFDTKGFRKRRQRHLEEGERVNESNPVVSHLH